jgi:hypothetical protein
MWWLRVLYSSAHGKDSWEQLLQYLWVSRRGIPSSGDRCAEAGRDACDWGKRAQSCNGVNSCRDEGDGGVPVALSKTGVSAGYFWSLSGKGRSAIEVGGEKGRVTFLSCDGIFGRAFCR